MNFSDIILIMDFTATITIIQVTIGIALLLYSVTIALKTKWEVPKDLQNKWSVLVFFLVLFVFGYFLFIALVASGLPFELELG